MKYDHPLAEALKTNVYKCRVGIGPKLEKLFDQGDEDASSIATLIQTRMTYQGVIGWNTVVSQPVEIGGETVHVKATSLNGGKPRERVELEAVA